MVHTLEPPEKLDMSEKIIFCMEVINSKDRQYRNIKEEQKKLEDRMLYSSMEEE